MHTSLPSDADTSVLTEVTYPLVSDEEFVSDKELLSDFEEEYSWEDIRGRDAVCCIVWWPRGIKPKTDYINLKPIILAKKKPPTRACAPAHKRLPYPPYTVYMYFQYNTKKVSL